MALVTNPDSIKNHIENCKVHLENELKSGQVHKCVSIRDDIIKAITKQDAELQRTVNGRMYLEELQVYMSDLEPRIHEIKVKHTAKKLLLIARGRLKKVERTLNSSFPNKHKDAAQQWDQMQSTIAPLFDDEAYNDLQEVVTFKDQYREVENLLRSAKKPPRGKGHHRTPSKDKKAMGGTPITATSPKMSGVSPQSSPSKSMLPPSHGRGGARRTHLELSPQRGGGGGGGSGSLGPIEGITGSNTALIATGTSPQRSSSKNQNRSASALDASPVRGSRVGTLHSMQDLQLAPLGIKPVGPTASSPGVLRHPVRNESPNLLTPRPDDPPPPVSTFVVPARYKSAKREHVLKARKIDEGLQVTSTSSSPQKQRNGGRLTGYVRPTQSQTSVDMQVDGTRQGTNAAPFYPDASRKQGDTGAASSKPLDRGVNASPLSAHSLTPSPPASPGPTDPEQPANTISAITPRHESGVVVDNTSRLSPPPSPPSVSDSDDDRAITTPSTPDTPGSQASMSSSISWAGSRQSTPGASELASVSSLNELIRLEDDKDAILAVKHSEIDTFKGTVMVYKAKDIVNRRLTESLLVVKTLDCLDQRMFDMKTYETETFQHFSTHPNVVQLYSHWNTDVPEEDLPELEDDASLTTSLELPYARLYLLFDHETSSLDNIGRKISPYALIKYLRDVCRALTAIHRENIIHCRIKPSNLFITRAGRCKVGLFGRCELDHARHHRHLFKDRLIGEAIPKILVYWAPEMFKLRRYGASSDLWSLGVTFFKVATGQFPFATTDVVAFRESVAACSPDWSLLDGHPELRTILENLIVPEPNSRWDAEAVLRYIHTTDQMSG